MKNFPYCHPCRDGYSNARPHKHIVGDVECIYHKKYTHFTENEITGSYHNDGLTWGHYLIIIFAVIAILLVIGEQTGLTSLIFGTV